MAGERPGAIGDPGDNLEDRCIAIAALPHAGGRPRDGPKQHPSPPSQFAAASTGDAFAVDREHAVLPGADLGDPHPIYAGAAQVRHQVHLGVFGNPIRAAGQRGQLLHRGREGAGIGHTSEPVVGVPPLPRVSHVRRPPHPGRPFPVTGQALPRAPGLQHRVRPG